tara:strand:- start:296 stop:697 length:402 start_codon:yes stop_codon:yes gene_type:complete
MCFNDNFVIEPVSGCWLWIAAASGDYGRKYHGGWMQQAHRVSYQLHVGPIAEGLVIDHLCRNKLCVNPEHLEAVTQSENCKRGDSGKAQGDRNLAKTHCSHGHELDGVRAKQRYCKTCHRQREAVRRAFLSLK